VQPDRDRPQLARIVTRWTGGPPKSL